MKNTSAIYELRKISSCLQAALGLQIMLIELNEKCKEVGYTWIKRKQKSYCKHPTTAKERKILQTFNNYKGKKIILQTSINWKKKIILQTSNNCKGKKNHTANIQQLQRKEKSYCKDPLQRKEKSYCKHLATAKERKIILQASNNCRGKKNTANTQQLQRKQKSYCKHPTTAKERKGIVAASYWNSSNVGRNYSSSGSDNF